MYVRVNMYLYNIRTASTRYWQEKSLANLMVNGFVNILTSLVQALTIVNYTTTFAIK